MPARGLWCKSVPCLDVPFQVFSFPESELTMSDPCTRRRWMQVTGAVGTTTILSSVAPAQPAPATPAAPQRRVKVASVKSGTIHAEADSNLAINISEDRLATTMIFDSLVASSPGWSAAVDPKTRVADAKNKKNSKPLGSKKVEPSCAIAHLNIDWSNQADNTLVGFTIDVNGITTLGLDCSATLMLSFGGKTFMHEFAGPLSANQPSAPPAPAPNTADAPATPTGNTADYALRFLVEAPFAKKEVHSATKLTAVITAQGGGYVDDTAVITIDAIEIEAAFKSFLPDPLPPAAASQTPRSNSASTQRAS